LRRLTRSAVAGAVRAVAPSSAGLYRVVKAASRRACTPGRVWCVSHRFGFINRITGSDRV